MFSSTPRHISPLRALLTPRTISLAFKSRSTGSGRLSSFYESAAEAIPTKNEGPVGTYAWSGVEWIFDFFFYWTIIL